MPGVSNLHVPLQPAAVGEVGSGGGVPPGVPAVCVHDDGAGPGPKSALWVVLPVG